MRKLIYILAILLVSCQKETIEPQIASQSIIEEGTEYQLNTYTTSKKNQTYINGVLVFDEWYYNYDTVITVYDSVVVTVKALSGLYYAGIRLHINDSFVYVNQNKESITYTIYK